MAKKPKASEPLTAFCGPHDRWDFATPFVQGGWRYATDGDCTVWEDAPGIEDATGRTLPNMGAALDKYPFPASLARTFADVKLGRRRFVQCEKCGGKGRIPKRVKCPECDGEGETTCDCCDHTHRCDKCGGACTVPARGTVRCDECAGTGRRPDENIAVVIEDVQHGLINFDHAPILKLARLPGLRFEIARGCNDYYPSGTNYLAAGWARGGAILLERIVGPRDLVVATVGYPLPIGP